MSGKALLDHFSALADPRQAWKVAYPLPELLLVVLCGTLAGAQNFVEIEDWGTRKLAFLRRLLPFKRGIPSHDTLTDVMNALPAETFSACFTSWVESLRESEPDIVAIDGKTSRRAYRGEAYPLHLVSAWASRQRIVLGQEAVASKSNEITAIPLLLERLELTGALVTIDAMGCQRDIARAIRARGADYLLALKDNWPTLAQDVRLFFDTAPASAFDTHETTDGDHGRIEVRRHRITQDVSWLTTDRRFPGEPRFPDLAAIGMVEAEVERDGRTTRARAASSYPLPAQRRFLRPRRESPLGRREPPPLGHGRRLPRRPDAASNRARPGQHGNRPSHGPQPAPGRPRQKKPCRQTKGRRVGRRLPPQSRQANRQLAFKRFPCATDPARPGARFWPLDNPSRTAAGAARQPR